MLVTAVTIDLLFRVFIFEFTRKSGLSSKFGKVELKVKSFLFFLTSNAYDYYHTQAQHFMHFISVFFRRYIISWYVWVGVVLPNYFVLLFFGGEDVKFWTISRNHLCSNNSNLGNDAKNSISQTINCVLLIFFSLLENEKVMWKCKSSNFTKKKMKFFPFLFDFFENAFIIFQNKVCIIFFCLQYKRKWNFLKLHSFPGKKFLPFSNLMKDKESKILFSA